MKQFFKYFFIFFFLFLFFSSCKTVEHSVMSVSTDTTRNISEKIKIQHDSIFIFKHDSIFIHAKNDTVFVEKWLTDIQRIIHYDTVHQYDTIYKSKDDKSTITTSNIVEKKVYVKWLFWLGLAIPVLLFAVWKIVKIYLKLN